MRTHGPALDLHPLPIPQETPRPLVDLAVAVLGILILLFCWTGVWYLVTRPAMGEAQSLGESVLQVLENAVRHLMYRSAVPVP